MLKKHSFSIINIAR